MSASARVAQMVRAHYRGDEQAFASAALALAKASKSPSIRMTISDMVKNGAARHRSGHRPLQPLPQASSPLLQALRPVAFTELMLDPAIQQMLDDVCEELEYAEELRERRLRPRNRLLFWGPPGCGKSGASAALAKQLGITAWGVSLPRVISKYLGETGQNLGQLFDSITQSTCVVFDEIDALGSRRGAVDQAAGKETNSVVNTMLTLLDRHRDGLIIGTTNRPDIVDPALLRRFDERVHFPAPSPAQSLALAEQLCSDYGIPLVDVSDCTNYDAVTKTVEREARRIVMAELRAADRATDDEPADDETPADTGGDTTMH